MYAVLCRREEINPPPAHLETKKGKNYDSTKRPARNLSKNSQMDIQQVTQPGQCSPGLFRIPVPVMSPGILGPQGTGHHPQGEKSQSYVNQSVHTTEHPHLRSTPAQKSDKSQQKSAAEDGVGKHIDGYVRNEPRTLKGRHKRCIVDFRFQAIDYDENGGKHGRERKNPSVAPPAIGEYSRKAGKERVPQTGLPHCP